MRGTSPCNTRESGDSDMELLEYINKHFDEIECELNGEEYEEPKHDRNLYIDCNVVKTIDYERSTLVCTKCGLCEHYPVYVASYNHRMQPLSSSFMVEIGLF